MNHKGLQVLMSGSVEVAGSQVPWLSRKSRVSPPAPYSHHAWTSFQASAKKKNTYTHKNARNIQ